MSNLVIPFYTSAGTKQFSALPIIFSGYQVKDSLLTNKLYPNGSTLNPSTVVGTGTATIQSVGRPLVANIYNTVFNPGNSSTQVPLVGTDNDYTRVSATAANDGVKWAVNWDMTYDPFLVIVAKSTAVSISAKLKVRDGTGNESICNFTTGETANTWDRYVFNVQDETFANVAFTGVPNFANIVFAEVTCDAITTSIDVAMIYSAPTLTAVIGNPIGYMHPCVSEASFENTLDTVDLLCGQEVVQSTGSARAASITIGAKKHDMSAYATSVGSVLRREKVYTMELIHSPSQNAKTIAAGTFTSVASLNIASVAYGDESRLSPVKNAADVVPGSYHYNSTSGVFTFSTQDNGKKPFVYAWNYGAKATLAVRNLELGFVGFLQVPRRTEAGKYKYHTCEKAQVMLESEALNEDFDQLNFKYVLYPTDGTYFKIAMDT